MSHTAPAPSPPITPTARPTWVRWQVVALLVCYSFMTWFNRVSMSVAYDERIKHQFTSPAEGGKGDARGQAAISEEAMGYVYSACLLAYTLCMAPGGTLIDRWGTRAALTVMGFGLVLFGVALVTATDGFFELKRTRDRRPDFAH